MHGRILLLELLKQQHHKPKAQSPGVVLHFRAHESKEIKMLDEESGARRDATRRDARDFRTGAKDSQVLPCISKMRRFKP